MGDVATMDVGDRHLEPDTINSKLLYLVNCGGGGGRDIVALQGDRGTTGARGLNGDSGNRGPAGSQDQLESEALNDPKVLLESLLKWDLLLHVVELEHVMKKVTRETLAVLVNKDL